ncbi:MAG: right-handed parallel beta-helix repeat-containing protein [Thermoplasmatota archaeon]
MKSIQKYGKKICENEGVSEIIGTVLLLAIAVIIFSSLIVYVLSMDAAPSAPDVHMVGSMESTNTAILENRGGDSIPLEDLKVIVWKGNEESWTYEGQSLQEIFYDLNQNGYWDVGDYVRINTDGCTGWEISAAIIDKPSNAIIMSGTLNFGVSEYLFTNNTEIATAADFSWSPAPVAVNNPVAFTDESINRGSILSWNWTFDSVGYSNIQDPSFTFSTMGTKSVTLNVTYPTSLMPAGVRNWDTVTYPVIVTDIPSITDNSPATAYTGDPYTFSFDISDSDGIETATLEYWFTGGSRHTVTKQYGGTNGTWENTTTVPLKSLASLNYIITATDTLGFEYSLPQRTVPVVDNDPPEIEDISPSNGTTGDPYTFSVNVTDNIDAASGLTVYVDWSHGSLSGNDTMSHVGGDTFERTITLDLNSTADMTYTFYAVDTAGNGNTTVLASVTVADNDPPNITDCSDAWAFWDNYFTFNASVIDNIAVANVYLEWWIDDGSHTNVSMTHVAGSYYNHSEMMPIDGTALYYIFAAVDTSGNWNDYYEFNRTLYSGHVHNLMQGTWYDQIYEATEIADPDDEIRVYPGTYDTHGSGNEEILIDDDGVVLTGRSSPDTVLLVSQQDGITVTADNVVIKNLTMIQNNNAAGTANSFKKGIYLDGASNVTIENVNISGAGQSAIYIVNSRNVVIRNCTLYKNRQSGLYIGSDSSNVYIENSDLFENDDNGVHIEGSDFNTLSQNAIHNNTNGVYIYRALDNNVTGNDIYGNDAGVVLEGANQESTTSNDINNNIIYDNHKGVSFTEYASNNTIIYNTIHNNSQYGIEIPFQSNKENNHNVIHHNNFMDNLYGNAYDECNNDWDDGIEGNYWDDWSSNGGYPTTYYIQGGSNEDLHPLNNPV